MEKVLVHIKILILISVITIGSSCATKPKEDVFPKNMPTMSEIYKEHNNEEETDRSLEVIKSRPTNDESNDLYGYTREAHNEHSALFPRLPNPRLVMYVYPHIAGSSDSGIPGYSTEFSMYEKVYYALPGEILNNDNNSVDNQVGK